MQSIVFDDIFYTCKLIYLKHIIYLNKIFFTNSFLADPVIVSAPTGSGKTVIFELAILKLLMHLEDINYKNHFNIIYGTFILLIFS